MVKRQTVGTLVESACHAKAVQLMLIVIIVLLGTGIIPKQILMAFVR